MAIGQAVDMGGDDLYVNNLYTGSSQPGQLVQAGPTVLRFVLEDVNFNSANTDNTVAINLPGDVTQYVVNSVRIAKASASISTATLGVFTAAAAGGQTIAANQAITVTQTATDTNNNTMSLTLTNANTEAYNDTTLFVRVGTAQGSAATADVIVTIHLLS